jgi:hypothetical protein
VSVHAAPSRHWVLGQFHDAHALLDAARSLKGEQLGQLDTHTPFPLHGADEALGLERSSVGWVAFLGGAIGGLTAYGLQLYFNAWEFPLNIANRPPHSPPVYVPVTFELTVLFSALAIVFSLVVGYWRMPQPYHPVFEHPQFVQTASSSGFWLSLNTLVGDDAQRARQRFEALGAVNVAIIEDKPEPVGGTW